MKIPHWIKPFRSLQTTGLSIIAGMLGYLLLFSQSLLAGTYTCDDAGLRGIIANGGHIFLGCNNTITLTNSLFITNNTIIDGTGFTPTISGGGLYRLFVVQGVTLELRHLTLTDGFAVGTNGVADGSSGGPGQGGAILNNAGQVILSDCHVINNTARGGLGVTANFLIGTGGAGQGGAIYNNGGSVGATNSFFTGNIARGGIGTNSGVSGEAYGGVLSQTGGNSIFFNCNFDLNIATSPTPLISTPNFASASSVYGGAIYQSGGSLDIIDCSFATNSAIGGTAIRVGTPGAGRGGAIYSAASLAISDSSFNWNSADAGTNGVHGADGEGGALYITQPASISNSSFSHNTARGGRGYLGGATPLPGGVGYGGTIYNSGTLKINGCTLDSGTVLGAQGACCATAGTAAFGGGIFNAGSVSATNSTFSGNRALAGSFDGATVPSPATAGGDAGGGGICNFGGSVQLLHVTLGTNSAVGGNGSIVGASLGGGIYNTNGTVTVTASIIANSPSGGNASGPITDGSHNISSDSTCSFSAIGSLNNTDPVLGPLDDYGGPTSTMALLAGSPAIDAADNSSAPPTDQRGRTRPFGALSDIGAFESSPPYSVHGRINGVFLGEVSVGNGTVSVTTVDHTYDLLNLVAGSHTITPSNSVFLLVPPSRIVTLGPDRVDIDFKAYRRNALAVEDYSNNVLHLIYSGTNGDIHRVLGSSNLLDWTSLSTNTVGSSNQFDFFSTNSGQRSYFFKTARP